jgi:DNA mismatch repair ATPase MutS
MVIDCLTARNLELTVNLSTRNDNETLLDILNETLTPMGGPHRSNILQPLTDERTISTRLDCVQELTQSEETFFSLRTQSAQRCRSLDKSFFGPFHSFAPLAIRLIA